MATTNKNPTDRDPDASVELTRADHQRQRTLEEIRAASKDKVAAAPPISWEVANDVYGLLYATRDRDPSELVVWRCRLYCGHVAEWTAHRDHREPSSHRCPECEQDMTIVAAKRLGPPREGWRPRPPRLPEKALPGRVRPQREVLAEVEQHNAKVRQRIREHWQVPEDQPTPNLEAAYCAAPETLFRWKIGLDCGCITETLTRGDDPAKLEGSTHRCRKSSHDHPSRRRIVEWRDRAEVCRTDLYEEYWREEYGISTPASRRHEHLALWTIVLECGHTVEQHSTAADFDPTEGPSYATPKRVAELRADRELAGDPDWQTWLEQGLPSPRQDWNCTDCWMHRSVVAYDPIGWLIPRERPRKRTTAQSKPSRAELERRLRHTEVEAARLRRQLELE
ncbi:hypothetical protein JD79_04105 [Geodermatophilus normandii]|uniref:Uncharacterized protein n=1 Tax=Geodermatophilus normandii TaxID=1137989 RepID=A0A317QPI5_9ACTN|nr:hypothetical protein [Geodermatophilus normandii]PWW24913.1 hypothetical protein JD79_04105 [Geodermatophilus normandii]